MTPMQAQRERRDDLTVEVQQLREHHTALTAAISKAGTRIMEASGDILVGGSGAGAVQRILSGRSQLAASR